MYLGELFECWLRKPVSLEQADAGCFQNHELRLGLDAFCEHCHSELLGDAHDAGHDGLAGRAGVDSSDELHVDLDQVS